MWTHSTVADGSLTSISSGGSVQLRQLSSKIPRQTMSLPLRKCAVLRECRLSVEGRFLTPEVNRVPSARGRTGDLTVKSASATETVAQRLWRPGADGCTSTQIFRGGWNA